MRDTKKKRRRRFKNGKATFILQSVRIYFPQKKSIKLITENNLKFC